MPYVDKAKVRRQIAASILWLLVLGGVFTVFVGVLLPMKHPSA